MLRSCFWNIISIRNGDLVFGEEDSEKGEPTPLMQKPARNCHSASLLVYVAFKLKPENTTVYQGHTAVLHCQATGDPSPIIQWKKKDKFLESNKSR